MQQAHARSFPIYKSKNMQQVLFKVFGVIHGLLAMKIKTIQCPLVKAQRDKFSSRPVHSFTAETVDFSIALGLTFYALLCFDVVPLSDENY